jgi:hypothetical protein
MRDVVNLAPKFLFAASLSQIYFPFQSIKFATSFILLSIAAHLFQTILETQLAVSLSFIATAALTQIPFINVLFIDKPAWRVAVAVLTLFGLIAFLYRSVVKKHHESHFFVEIAPAIAMFIISFYWSSSRNLGGLNFLGQSEDNAAWFMGLSFGLSDAGGIHYVRDMKWGGGSVFGVFNGWIVGLKSLGLSREYSSFDNVGSLLSAFGLLLMLTVGSLASVVLRFARRMGSGMSSMVPLFVGSVVVMYSTFASVMGYGHYTFMVAIWLLISAVSVRELNLDAHLSKINLSTIELIRPFLVSTLVVAASLSWRAITPAAIFVCAHYLVTSAYPIIRKRRTKGNSVLIVGIAFLVTYLFFRIMGGDVKRGLDIQNLKRYFSLDGGAATVSILLLSTFALIAFVSYLLLAETQPDQRASIEMVISGYMMLVFVLMISIALPTVYGIRYVIQKFEFLLFISLIPLCFFAIVKFGIWVKQKYATGLLVMLLLMMCMYDGSLNSGFSYPLIGRSQETIWAKAATSELLNHPERHVVCLNTKNPDEEVFTDYAAYTCNRILIGIQGLEGNDDYEDWTRLGMWLVDTSRLRSLPDSYYENMTFIVFDSTFSRIGDEIFMSALNGIPWELVRIVDLDGNQINKT